MIDPLHLTTALDFLGSSPAPRTTLSLATVEHRRAMLEDTTTALSFFAGCSWSNTGPAQHGALDVFELSAAVWRGYLSTFPGSFDTAALNLHAWARDQVVSSFRTVPASLCTSLPESFPEAGAWVAAAHKCGALSLPEAGAAAAWWAVCILAAMVAGPGFADGEPEDLIDALLSSLEGVGRVMN